VSGVAARVRRVVSWERMSDQSAGRALSWFCFRRRREVLGWGLGIRWSLTWATRSAAFDGCCGLSSLGGDGEVDPCFSFESLVLMSTVVYIVQNDRA
jgi:hypothetical protein